MDRIYASSVFPLLAQRWNIVVARKRILLMFILAFVIAFLSMAGVSSSLAAASGSQQNQATQQQTNTPTTTSTTSSPSETPNQNSSSSNSSSSAMSFAQAFFFSRGSVFGTIQIWFLILLSMFSVGLMGYLWVINRRIHILPDQVVTEARVRIVNKQYRELLALANNDTTYFGSVLAASLREAPHGYGAMIRALEQAGDEFTTRRFRKLELLSVIGNVAPMIGLFGTVYGMILAFQEIVSAGGRPSPVQLAAGIGTALVTTFWGLVIGIPCLAVYALIRNSVDALTSESLLIAQDLINNFRPGGGGGAGAAAQNPVPTATAATVPQTPPRHQQQHAAPSTR